jgi:hypothetical protein
MDLLYFVRTRIIAPGFIIAFLLYFIHGAFTSAGKPPRLDDLDRPGPRPIPTPSASERNPAEPVKEFGDYAFLPTSLSNPFPAPDGKRKDYHEWNALSLRELYVCMALDNCGVNQRKVALLASHWFEEAIVRGWRGGEGVWCVSWTQALRTLCIWEELILVGGRGLSMYKHLKAMGYTTMFANSFEEALAIYRLFPSLISVVVRNKAGECHSDPKCVKSESNPTGIPAWKIFDFEYFPSTTGSHFHASLLKGKWILSANPERGNSTVIQYIG